MGRLKAFDIEEERVLAGRLAGALYLIGAATGLLLLVLPGVDVSSPAVLVALCAVGAAWGVTALLAVDWKRAPGLVSHLSTGLGLPITAVAMSVTGGAESPALFYIFFVAFYCSFFYSPREAAPHLVGCGVVVLLPVFYAPHAVAEGALAQALVVIPTLAVLAWLIMGGKAVLVDLRDRAHALALRDPLTELWNRRAFTDSLDDRLEGGAAGRPVGLLMLDLDRFKAANTDFGHPAGDRILCRVAGLLRAATRAQDMVARLGGDEFAVLVEDADEADMTSLSERVLCAFRSAELGPDLDGYELRGSAGWVVGRSGAQTAEDLVRSADLALRAAKSAGKDRWQAQRQL
jgi:diguanylate cyclase (GGDEF)-like protein